MDLFLVDHICANVFKVAFNSVCETAKFGAVFYFSHLSLYMGTVKQISSSLVVSEILQL